MPKTQSFNLDELERDAVPEPFSVQIGGRVVRFGDLDSVPWQRRREAYESGQVWLECVLSPTDLEYVLAQPLPVWKFRRLMAAYLEHFAAQQPEQQDTDTTGE